MKVARRQLHYRPPRAFFARTQTALLFILTPLVTATGCLERPTTLDTLPADLSQTLRLDDPTLPPTEQRVYIRADKTVRYGDFMAVMNTLQGNGFYQVALINEDI